MNEISARKIEVLEAEIVMLKNQTAQNIIEIGKRLIEAKEQLPHGEWGKWLEEKVDFSQAGANKFMRVANEFSNSSALTNLNQTKIFALLDLPQDQRQDFIQSNPVDEMTTRELQAAIKAQKEAERKAVALEQDLQTERNKPAQVVEKVVEKEPSDYGRLKQTVTELNRKLQDRSLEIDTISAEAKILAEKVKLNEQEAERYKTLKTQISALTQHKQDLSRQIESAAELGGMVVEIEDFLKTKLAPIRYSRSLERLDSKVSLKNLTDILGSVEKWCGEMRRLLPTSDYMEVTDYESVD